MSDDLRINRLQRYEKQSDRLVLEEHSAGCGGILLRWRDPNEGEPIRFDVVASGEAELFVDGVELESPRTILKRGEHLLAIRVTRESQQPRMFAATAYYDVQPAARGYDVTIPSLTTGNTGWLMHSGDSDQERLDWTQPDFDDSNWTTPLETEVPGRGYDELWRYRMLVQRGVKALSIPDTPELWIRKPFSIQART